MSTDPPRGHRPHSGPTIDMTPDGELLAVRQSGTLPFSTKLVAAAIVVAVLAGALGIAMLALWLALTLIPIAIGGALIAYGAFRVQIWWARRRSLGGQRHLLRP